MRFKYYSKEFDLIVIEQKNGRLTPVFVENLPELMQAQAKRVISSKRIKQVDCKNLTVH